MINKKNNFSKLKSDFPFFNKNRNLVFFDSAATTLKPRSVIAAVNDYYENYSTNNHSIDFPLALATNEIYENCRLTVANLINGKPKEIIFCPSTTFAFNQIFYSLSEYLQAGDEIVLTSCEHSAVVLPLYRLAQVKKLVLKFIPVTDDGLITVENLKKVLTQKTRVVTFANMNNSFGTINDTKSLTKIFKNYQLNNLNKSNWPFEKILVLIDGAQAIAHIKNDVKDWDIDFFAFSGHKIFGPTGIAVWWTKEKWLKLFKPLILGGGISGTIEKDGNFAFLPVNNAFEAGSANIAGVFGLKAAIEYLLKLGLNNIYHHEKQLKTYAVKQFKKHFANKIVIYNEKQPTGILLFNVNNAFAEDVANYLGIKNICLRSGNFCAKLLSDVIHCASSLRASFSIYNNKEDIDKLVTALQTGFKDGGDFLNEFFN